MRPSTLLAPVLFAAALLAAAHALAQERVDIRFRPGATDAEINGTIVGREYIDYVLTARAGQTMVVSLTVTGTNGTGSAYFNILPAGRDYPALFVGSNEGRRAEVTLPSDGAWAIRVYLMGNDRDAGRTVGYSINVYIPPTGGGGGSGAGGPPPEEDFFVVRLSSAGGALNVRNAPRPSGRLLGQFANGTTVRNAGGCVMSDGQQWCDVAEPRSGLRGWVAARFLALPGPGGGASTPTPPAGGAPVVQVTGVPANDVLNVRAGPGTQHGVVGALANGDSVRRLECRPVGGSRWCEIEMLSEMRERGWVNARYISKGGAASQLPGDALVPGTAFNATGQIACTNQAGQTMFDCDFGVIRRGGGSATVVVTLPTGNRRTIDFENGRPVSSDAPARLTHSRSGDVTTIRIGNTERYEIFDAVVFGG